MPKKKKNARDGDLFSNVQDYRHEQATRKNNPPAISAVDATSPSRFLKTGGGDAAST